MILHRYLAWETAKPFCTALLFLVGVFITYSLTRLLTEANQGLLDASSVFLLTGLKAVIALEVLLPIALYIALIVALGRLYSDWEIAALKASGFSESRVLTPVLGMAAAVALTVAALSLWGRPWAYETLYHSKAAAEAEVELDALPAGQFHIHGDGRRTIYLASRDGADGALNGVFVHSRKDGVLQIISAGGGHLHTYAHSDAHQLDLTDGVVYRQSPSTENLVSRFGHMKLRVPAETPAPLGYRPKATATGQLLASRRNEDRAEAQWRLSTALSTLLLALAAVPLSRTRPRSGRYARVLLAVVIYALYFNFLGIARSEVKQGALAHLWWAPAGFGVFLAAVWVAARRAAP